MDFVKVVATDINVLTREDALELVKSIANTKNKRKAFRKTIKIKKKAIEPKERYIEEEKSVKEFIDLCDLDKLIETLNLSSEENISSTTKVKVKQKKK